MDKETNQITDPIAKLFEGKNFAFIDIDTTLVANHTANAANVITTMAFLLMSCGSPILLRHGNPWIKFLSKYLNRA